MRRRLATRSELGQLADAPPHRLYRPVFYYLAFWVSALAILRYFLPEHVYDPVAGISIQLLWFLGAYVLVLAAVPLLARITTTGRLLAAVVERMRSSRSSTRSGSTPRCRPAWAI